MVISYLHFTFRGNVRASLSSSSLVKEPLIFRTDFIVRQQQPSNINMTIAPLSQQFQLDADAATTTSSDTSSSDALDSDGAGGLPQVLRPVAYKCSHSVRAESSLGTRTPPATPGNAESSDTSPEENRKSCSPSLTNVTDDNSTAANLASSFSNLTTSLMEFGSSEGKLNADDNAKVMTASFTNLSGVQHQTMPGLKPPKSLSSMPDLSMGGGGRWVGGRGSKGSVSCRAYWARVNAVMLATHK